MALSKRFSGLVAKVGEVDLGDDLIIKCKSLSMPQLTEFITYVESKDNKKSFNFLVFTQLRANIPKEGEEDGMSDEEIYHAIEYDYDGIKLAKIVSEVKVLSGLIKRKELEGKKEMVNEIPETAQPNLKL